MFDARPDPGNIVAEGRVCFPDTRVEYQLGIPTLPGSAASSVVASAIGREGFAISADAQCVIDLSADSLKGGNDLVSDGRVPATEIHFFSDRCADLFFLDWRPLSACDVPILAGTGAVGRSQLFNLPGSLPHLGFR